MASAKRSGMASALLNNSREVAGLLGITVIDAVLRSREGAALAHGVASGPAFLDGYHAGLAVTIALIVAGVFISYSALRRLPGSPPALAPVAAGAASAASAVGADGAVGEPASGQAAGPAAGPELAGRRS